MGAAGTSIENGATVPASYRFIRVFQIPEPTTEPARAVYSSATGPVRSPEVSESPRARQPAVGPSRAADRPSSGIGGSTHIQSAKRSGWSGRACRLAILPIAQPNAATRVSTSGSRAASCARSTAMALIPATASTMPPACRREMRSPSSSPSSMVNGAAACTTTDACPEGMPMSMARKSSPNWITPKPSPYTSSQRRGTLGRGTKRITGTATTTNRIAERNTGG